LFCANIYGLLDTGMAILQLCHFVADFIRLKLNFIFKKPKHYFLSHPMGDLGVMYTLHL